VLYINMLTFPVSAVGWVASMIQRASASQKRLNEFLDTKPTITSPAEMPAVEPKGKVEFRNVHFTYPHTGIKALSHLDLTILPGQKIAVIGKTGSGKSTIAQLLLRMYDADQGDILIDGLSVKQYDLTRLRKEISYVPQDVFLFSDTVENNIRFGHDTATTEEVTAAAEMAAVAGEIDRFAKGYKTLVGERGVTLSGGQKQRISIARALLKPSSVIIFDDCLSAVDAKTEKEVLRSLDQYLNKKTAIIITHRIFSLLHFDHIILMEDGEIIEQGTHDALLAKGGEYTSLYMAQQAQDAMPE
jgi:ATP-binding cassette, subfamily B, multidrug efflux pump